MMISGHLMTSVERAYLLSLFVAYSGVWVVMFGFMHRLMGKLRSLEGELTRVMSQTSPTRMRPGARSALPPVERGG
jgi:hypothetical protein